MPSKVYNNVEGHRVIDNERVAEDVTSVHEDCRSIALRRSFLCS